MKRITDKLIKGWNFLCNVLNSHDYVNGVCTRCKKYLKG